MKTFLKLLESSVLSLVALIVLCLLVWFGGEYFEYPVKQRVLVIAIILAVWLFLYVLQKVLAVRNALRIERRLRAQAEAQMASIRPDRRPEVQALEKQLTEAIQSLKSSRLGKGALYALPWYIIIGPPGVGKTTALVESGLNFPYMSQGRKGIRGVGGTRNCDWWFTDRGILLDTAGRYTTELEDRDEWLSFLDMLRKCRRRKPINGAIVAMSIQDILEAGEDQLEEHAKNIRDRIDELTRRLELVFPVYLLFTKCDLLDGFVEFFEDFSKTDRAQVWGATLAYELPGGPAEALFEEEMKRIYGALQAQRIRALAGERPSGKKRAIYSFPIQFALAQKKLAAFAAALCRPNPYQESSVLRGFYFTSGTQEGAPIDQVVGALRQAFGLGEEEQAGARAPAEKKSYFLHDLFTKVIFPDQDLARSSAKAERRARVIRYAALGASAAVFLFLATCLIISFIGNRRLVASVGDAALRVRETETMQPDLNARLLRLDDLRRELEGLDRFREEGVPFALRWGLYRGPEIDEPARRVYFDQLRTLFLRSTEADLLAELEARRAQERKDTLAYEQLYDVYRVYRMLCKEIPPAQKLIVRILSEKNPAGRFRWFLEGAEPGILAGQEHLRFYASQIEREDSPGFREDEALIERINTELKDTLWIDQSLDQIIDLVSGSRPRVTVDSLITARGKSLLRGSYEFSSLYTQAGWDDYVKRAIREKSRALSENFEELKLGRPADEIEEELRQNYLNDYTNHWRSFLAGVSLDPEGFRNLEAAAESLEMLTGPDSPYRELFEKVWAMQAITIAEGNTRNAVKSDFEWLKEVLKGLYDLKQNLNLYRLATSPGKRVLKEREVNKDLAGLARSFHEAMELVGKSVNAIAEPIQRERAEAILQQPIRQSIAALSREAQDEANALWRRDVLEPFQAKASGRFPFSEDASDEVSRSDFSALFNPKTGVLWAVHESLKSLESLTIEGQPLIQPSLDFQHRMRTAALFRDALYEKDGDRIRVPFSITLIQRFRVEEIELRVGARTFLFSERPDHTGSFVWSEAEPGDASLSINLGSILVGEWVRKDHSRKEWGLLRLFRQGAISGTSREGFDCRWEFPDVPVAGGSVNDFVVDSKVRFQPDRNPFLKGFFSEFECPASVCP